jgi:hypothetical protein
MQKHIVLQDHEIVRSNDIVVRSGLCFESNSDLIQALKAVIENYELYLGSDFKNTSKKYILCAETGYGNGNYTAKKIKELVGGSAMVAAIIRLTHTCDYFTVSKPKPLSSYANPLPLP